MNSKCKNLFYVSMALLLTPQFAHAQATPIDGMLTKLIGFLTGNIGLGIAVLAVIGIGFMWMFGRMEVMRAAMVLGGIAVVFGSAQIVALFAG